MGLVWWQVDHFTVHYRQISLYFNRLSFIIWVKVYVKILHVIRYFYFLTIFKLWEPRQGDLGHQYRGRVGDMVQDFLNIKYRENKGSICHPCETWFSTWFKRFKIIPLFFIQSYVLLCAFQLSQCLILK